MVHVERSQLGFGQIGYLRSAIDSKMEIFDTRRHCLEFELTLGSVSVTQEEVTGWLETLVEVHPMLGAILHSEGDRYSWVTSGGEGVPLRQISRDEHWLESPFDPAGALWRARLFERGEDGQNVLQLAVHHLVADSAAVDVLSRDLQKIIAGDAGSVRHDGVWDFIRSERARWTEARATRTLEHWRRAAKQQVAPFSPPGGLRRHLIHGQAGRRLASTDLAKAITQTRAWRSVRAPIIVAASNRWIRRASNVVTSLVQPGVLVAEGSGWEKHDEAVLDATYHAWFDPKAVQGVLPAGLMSSGDGFTYATNLIVRAEGSDKVRSLPQLIKEESSASQQFENYVVVQQFEDNYALIKLVMSGSEDRVSIEELAASLLVDD